MMIILAADIPRGVTLVQCFESEFEESSVSSREENPIAQSKTLKARTRAINKLNPQVNPGRASRLA